VYTISKTFTFDAAHRLFGIPDGHKCARMHGHTYKATFVFQSLEVDEKVAWVFDYGDLAPIKEWIDTKLDHRTLNDVMLTNPTAEGIAWFMFQTWKRTFPSLVAVEVQETPNTAALYQGRDATG